MTEMIQAALGWVDSLHQLVAALVVLGVCGLAWAWGRPTERWGATAIFLAYLAALLVQNTTDWLSPQFGLVLVDVGLLAALGGLALASNRYWLIVAAGLHLLSVLAHVAVMVDRTVLPLAYIIVLNLIGYLVLGALLIGIFEGRRLDRATERAAP